MTQAIPPGMTAVTPHLVCRNAAAAIEFYKEAFGAVEGGRLPAPDGRLMHAHITIGGAAVMLVDEFPEQGCQGPQALGGSAVTLHLYVADVDATVAQAVAAGATLTLVDGPFAEAKEMVGGFYLLDVATRDEAVAIARQCPAVDFATVEVRECAPCHVL